MNRTQTSAAHAFAAALMLASGPGLAGLEDPVALAPDQRTAFGIEVAAPQPADQVLSRRYPGQVTVPVRQTHVVSAPLDGTLTGLLVAEGETVEAGQPLARMQSPGAPGDPGSPTQGLLKLSLARSELDRDRALFAEGLAPKRRLEATQAQFNELATTVDQWSQRLALSGMPDQAIEALKRDRRLSGTLEVRAPIGGVVLEQMVGTGQSVAAATPLYRIAGLTPLWLEIHVPWTPRRGTGRRPRRPPARRHRGTILAVGRMVHGQDQGVLVRAESTEGTDHLRPGQFVEVQFGSTADGAAGGTGQARAGASRSRRWSATRVAPMSLSIAKAVSWPSCGAIEPGGAHCRGRRTPDRDGPHRRHRCRRRQGGLARGRRSKLARLIQLALTQRLLMLLLMALIIGGGWNAFRQPQSTPSRMSPPPRSRSSSRRRG